MQRNGKIVLAFVAIVAACAFSQVKGQDATPLAEQIKSAPPNPGGDVPETAKLEIQRRGHMVQQVGTFSASATDAIADALAPPESDAHRWYFTLITKKGCPPCEALKRDLQSSETLRAWVDLSDPAKSTFHFQERKVEDATQRDWLEGVDAQLRKNGVPCVVIQPPRNGEYGANSTVVAAIHGYSTPTDLDKRLRRAIIAYVEALHRKGGIKHVGENSARGQQPSSPVDPPDGAAEESRKRTLISGGMKQAAPQYNEGGFGQLFGQGGLVGGPPPFTQPRPNNVPSTDWPPFLNQPQPLTPEQIRQILPNAPLAFQSYALTMRLTTPAEVMQVYQQWQAENMQPAKPVTPLGPETCATTSEIVAMVLAVLTVTGAICLFGIGTIWLIVSLFRAHRKNLQNLRMISDRLNAQDSQSQSSQS
jgi:hypothetical protein